MAEMRFTKGDCYAICEFVDSMVQHNLDAVHDIADALGYDRKGMLETLAKLSGAFNACVVIEQQQRDDTDQMADIAVVKHIPFKE